MVRDKLNTQKANPFVVRKPADLIEATKHAYIYLLNNQHLFIIFVSYLIACVLTKISNWFWVGVVVLGISFYVAMRQQAIKDGIWSGFK